MPGRSGLLALVLLLLTSSPVRAAKIAVLDIETDGVPAATAAAVQEMIVQGVVRSRPKDTVISGKDLEALLKIEKQKLAFATLDADRSSFERIAQTMNTDFVVSGTLKMLDGQAILTLSLIDANAAGLQARETAELKGGGTELIPQITSLVRGLFGARGTLQLINQVNDAQVYLNGQFIGKMPLDKLSVKQTGTFELKVLHDDYAPFVRTITVSPGSVTRVPLWMYKYTEIAEKSEQRKYWGFGLLGAGAIGLGLGVWQYQSALDARDTYNNEIDEPTPSTQVGSKRQRLSALEDQANTRYQTSFAAGGAGLALVGAGTYLLVVNPWADQLEAIAGLRPELKLGSDRALLAFRWGGSK